MNILLINQGHTDNLGDKAIAKVISDIICKNFDVNIINMPFIPYEKNRNLVKLKKDVINENKHNDISKLRKCARTIKRTINRKNTLNLYSEKINMMLDNSITYDFAIIGGGELIKGNNHPFFYSLQAWSQVLNKKNIPTMLLGVSSDSEFKNSEIKKLKRVLSKFSKIGVRDEMTRKLFYNMFNIECEYIPDIVFTYRYLNSSKISQIEKNNKVGICIYSFDELSNKKKYNNSIEEYYAYWFNIIENLSEDAIPILSYTTYSDYCESVRFKIWLKNKKNYVIDIEDINTFEELVNITSKYNKIISGRMHSLILAMQYNTTICPIIIKDKLSIFKEEWGDCKYNYMKDGKRIYEQYTNLLIKNLK